MQLLLILGSSIILHFGLLPLLSLTLPPVLKIILALTIILAGAIYPLSQSANLIEAATGILSKKTKIAAGLLQAFGTAFPDMVLGITAAIISLSYVTTDPAKAIAFAMIAAATTFGSNIYNIGHAAWCIWRQNHADRGGRALPMFPGFPSFGMVTPVALHKVKPKMPEIDVSVRVLTILTILTATVALAMVMFGHIGPELYTLVRPAGGALMAICIAIIIHFRRRGSFSGEESAAEESSTLTSNHPFYLWLALLTAGITIALTATSMVQALEIGSAVAHIPYVLSGALAGIFGCLGEMLVVHNYTIHANGRLGDAIVGVAMDNIVTILGAAIVAIMGGIFLGSTSLIVIFVIILALNTVLIDQISRLKTTLVSLK